jgi:hypothetical protein
MKNRVVIPKNPLTIEKTNPRLKLHTNCMYILGQTIKGREDRLTQVMTAGIYILGSPHETEIIVR